MEAGNTFTLTNGLRIRVAAGQFGIYVQLFRNEKWINFSHKAWKFVNNNIETISNSLNTESEYGLTISSTKDVKISQFRGQGYVSFHERVTKDGDVFDKYINLSEEEWGKFVSKLDIINNAIQQDVIFKSPNGKWHLVKEAAATENDEELSYGLAPRMKNGDIVLRLYAYRICEEIDNYLKKNCIGCTYDAPGQWSHMSPVTGCLQEWEEAVTYHFATAKAEVVLEKSLELLNAAMGWKVIMPKYIDDNKLYKLIQHRGQTDIECDCSCMDTVLPELYDRLFGYLKL